MNQRGAQEPARASAVNDDVFRQWSKRLPSHPLIERNKFILDLALDQDVVHLGACDFPFARDSATSGTLLHQLLERVARTLVGYDLDQASIDLLRNEFGVTNIERRDLSRDDPTLEARGSLVICGDVIEHVNNVGELISNCNRLLRPNGKLLLTTVNALALKTAMRALFRREAVHIDHVAYYSYSTLGVLLGRFGFRVVDCRYFSYAEKSLPAKLIFGTALRLAPQSADGIAIVAEKTQAVA